MTLRPFSSLRFLLAVTAVTLLLPGVSRARSDFESDFETILNKTLAKTELVQSFYGPDWQGSTEMTKLARSAWGPQRPEYQMPAQDEFKDRYIRWMKETKGIDVVPGTFGFPPSVDYPAPYALVDPKAFAPAGSTIVPAEQVRFLTFIAIHLPTEQDPTSFEAVRTSITAALASELRQALYGKPAAKALFTDVLTGEFNPAASVATRVLLGELSGALNTAMNKGEAFLRALVRNATSKDALHAILFGDRHSSIARLRLLEVPFTEAHRQAYQRILSDAVLQDTSSLVYRTILRHAELSQNPQHVREIVSSLLSRQTKELGSRERLLMEYSDLLLRLLKRDSSVPADLILSGPTSGYILQKVALHATSPNDYASVTEAAEMLNRYDTTALVYDRRELRSTIEQLEARAEKPSGEKDAARRKLVDVLVTQYLPHGKDAPGSADFAFVLPRLRGAADSLVSGEGKDTTSLRATLAALGNAPPEQRVAARQLLFNVLDKLARKGADEDLDKVRFSSIRGLARLGTPEDWATIYSVLEGKLGNASANLRAKTFALFLEYPTAANLAEADKLLTMPTFNTRYVPDALIDNYRRIEEGGNVPAARSTTRDLLLKLLSSPDPATGQSARRILINDSYSLGLQQEELQALRDRMESGWSGTTELTVDGKKKTFSFVFDNVRPAVPVPDAEVSDAVLRERYGVQIEAFLARPRDEATRKVAFEVFSSARTSGEAHATAAFEALKGALETTRDLWLRGELYSLLGVTSIPQEDIATDTPEGRNAFLRERAAKQYLVEAAEMEASKGMRAHEPEPGFRDLMAGLSVGLERAANKGLLSAGQRILIEDCLEDLARFGNEKDAEPLRKVVDRAKEKRDGKVERDVPVAKKVDAVSGKKVEPKPAPVKKTPARKPRGRG